MLRAYAFRIGLFAVIGLLVGLVIALLTPKKYEALMQILVDPRPMMNARAMTDAEASVTDIVESTAPRSVQTQVEQLTGFGVLQKAAEAVAQERGSNLDAFPELSSFQSLQKSVSVEAATESDLITLSVRMSNPDLARDFASQIYIAFDDQNQQKSKEVGERALQSLQTQTTGIEQQLKSIDDQVHDLRRKYNAPDIAVKVQYETQNLKTMEQARDQALSEMTAAEARMVALRQEIATVPRTVPIANSSGPNPTMQRIDGELSDARAELRQLQAIYSDDAEQVKASMQKVKQYERDVNRMQQQIKLQNTEGPNLLYQNLQAELSQSVGLAAAARERYNTLDKTVREKQTMMQELPDAQRKIQELDRQQEALTRTYQDYRQRLQTLKVAGQGRLTTSTIVSPALALKDPVSPNIPLNLGAGLIAGLLLGLLSAFGTESRRSPIRTLSQLNRLTLEPAFRSIPELPFVPLGTGRQPDDVFVSLLGNFVRSPKRPYRVGVLGVDPETGATVAASSMALAASLEGHSTLLVDTAKENGAARRLGLAESEQLINANERLTVLRTGGEELTQAHDIVDHVRSLEEARSLTVIDLHPFKASGNPVLYLAGLDECILLVRAGRTRTVDFLQAQQMLTDAGVPQITVVLARARSIDDDFTFMPSETQAQALMTR